MNTEELEELLSNNVGRKLDSFNITGITIIKERTALYTESDIYVGAINYPRLPNPDTILHITTAVRSCYAHDLSQIQE